ncbi:hypothetical protein J5N97_016862 [Dioscorea zingiberensis]|uniref:Uncharacterized protein n=1 Tax=Dioscorea zingiberensis TaxID=325984 RepID=A0A9D5HG21_9LILI|nr:hypothetical protein J5N97_016862 [Dioscorea zingiberensis]
MKPCYNGSYTATKKPGYNIAKNDQNDVVCRPIANYHPSLWGDYFILNHLLSSTCQQRIKLRVAELTGHVKVLLKDARGSLEELELIDALQRLGVAYHFEEEINEALSLISKSAPILHNDNDHLHNIALRFRLLRQHHYHVPSDVFNRFKDDKGNFKTELSNDLKGLLSLYEAAYLCTPEEDVLDEAIDFTRRHLQSMVKDIEPRLARQVAHALETPSRRRMKRLEARLYISIYEEDVDARNDVVLELAKLDFHILQLLHQEEVKKISMWWKDLGFSTKLTFARDRVVELYFWILGVYFEPQYSRARMMMTKVIAMLSIMDDIYDSYGTLGELQHFTDAIQRWDLKASNQMEECLKVSFLALYRTMEEIEDEVRKDGKLYRIDYLRREIEKMAIVWLEESKWRDEGYMPSLVEHIDLSIKTTAYHALACASFLGMGEIACKQSFDWVTSFPQICKAISTISRLMDDVVDYEVCKDSISISE